MIKIAFVIDAIYAPTGGTERQLLTLISSLDSTAFAPTLCVLRSTPWSDASFHLCPLHTIGIRSFKHLDTMSKLIRFSRFLATGGFDIVQTHLNDGNKIGVIGARLAGVPVIISTRRNQGYWHTAGELAILKTLNRWVSCFVTNSQSTCEWAASVEGIRDQRITVIYNGLQPGLFPTFTSEERNHLRSRLGLAHECGVVGIVANLRPVKRLDVFLQCARLVLDRLPGTRFVMVGAGAPDGTEEARLKKLVALLNLEENVLFLGERSDIADILGALDVGVLTSESESFSNALAEYLAAGLPVVSTDVGGAREAVVDGENGFVVPINDPAALADKIVLLLSEDNLDRFQGTNRQKAARLFSISRMADQYEHLYRTLTGGVRSKLSGHAAGASA